MTNTMIRVLAAMALVAASTVAHEIDNYEHDDDTDFYHGSENVDCLCADECKISDEDDEGAYYCSTMTWQCKQQDYWSWGLGYVECWSSNEGGSNQPYDYKESSSYPYNAMPWSGAAAIAQALKAEVKPVSAGSSSTSVDSTVLAGAGAVAAMVAAVVAVKMYKKSTYSEIAEVSPTTASTQLLQV